MVIPETPEAPVCVRVLYVITCSGTGYYSVEQFGFQGLQKIPLLCLSVKCFVFCPRWKVADLDLVFPTCTTFESFITSHTHTRGICALRGAFSSATSNLFNQSSTTPAVRHEVFPNYLNVICSQLVAATLLITT